jgi:small-conductance mechanosensitive channel
MQDIVFWLVLTLNIGITLYILLGVIGMAFLPMNIAVFGWALGFASRRILRRKHSE